MMEGNEIVKALRACSNTMRCTECPLQDMELCLKRMMVGAYDLIKEQAMEIQELQNSLAVLGQANAALRDKVPEWIPVKERLPEIGVKVLTLDKRGHIRDRVYKSYTNGKPYFYPDGLEPGRDIKAWMPVPEEAEHGEIRKS